MKRLLFFTCAAAFLVGCGSAPTDNPTDPTTSDSADVTTDVVTTPTPTATYNGVPFNVTIEPAANQSMLTHGLHSFAHGDSDGKWLIIGGRTNGFHTMFGANRMFPMQYANDQIWVVDPASGTSYSAPVPAAYQEQFTSNNTESVQVGDTLYIVGGYGAPDLASDSAYITFNYMTAVNVPSMIANIIANGANADISTDVYWQIQDETLRVTGGGLERIGNYFYLAMGQNYNKAYNETSGIYNNHIVQFHLSGAGTPSIVIDETFTDGTAGDSTSRMHRRDYNLRPQMSNGQRSITAFAGVFTITNGAWPTRINITQDAAGAGAVAIDETWQQKANYYESPAIVMYDPAAMVTYTTCLGGISNYFWDDATSTMKESAIGPLSERLPFVRIINTIASLNDGTTDEYLQEPPYWLRGQYLGANGVFIADEGMAYDDGILDYSKVSTTDPTKIGYMFGGIRSTGSQSGNGATTMANDTIYEVWVNPISN